MKSFNKSSMTAEKMIEQINLIIQLRFIHETATSVNTHLFIMKKYCCYEQWQPGKVIMLEVQLGLFKAQRMK